MVVNCIYSNRTVRKIKVYNLFLSQRESFSFTLVQSEHFLYCRKYEVKRKLCPFRAATIKCHAVTGITQFSFYYFSLVYFGNFGFNNIGEIHPNMKFLPFSFQLYIGEGSGDTRQFLAFTERNKHPRLPKWHSRILYICISLTITIKRQLLLYYQQ